MSIFDLKCLLLIYLVYLSYKIIMCRVIWVKLMIMVYVYLLELLWSIKVYIMFLKKSFIIF